MKYTAVITDGSFPSRSAAIQAPVREAFRMAKAAGYDGVQLTIRDTSDYDAEELKQLMAETGLSIDALATGRVYSIDRLSLGAGDEAVRTGAVARMKRIAEFSVPLGCPALIIGAVRGTFSDAATTDLYMEQLEKSIRELVSFCEPLSVPVILEAIDRDESRAFCDPEETLAFVKRVGSPCFHMYLDTMHLHREHYDVTEVLRDYAPYAFQIDISGEDRNPPMDSVIEFRAAVKAIMQSGFDGILNFEIPAEQEKAPSLQYIKSLVGSTKEGRLMEAARTGQLKNIIFDVGHVLLSYQWAAPLLNAGLPEEEAIRISREIARSHLWPLLDYGIVTIPEIVEKYSMIYPEDAENIALWFSDLESLPIPREEIWKRVHLLKEAGYRLYLLSNYEEVLFRTHTAGRPFMDDMSGGVISYEVHMVKPEERIYRFLLKKYGLRPEECAFFDDRPENCLGADDAGILGVQVLSEEQFARILDALLSAGQSNPNAVR